jgi:hypothetical protein
MNQSEYRAAAVDAVKSLAGATLASRKVLTAFLKRPTSTSSRKARVPISPIGPCSRRVANEAPPDECLLFAGGFHYE